MATKVIRPTIYITDNFETWKNKINGMVDWVEDNMELLLEDCVEELVSRTMDDRAIIMSLIFNDNANTLNNNLNLDNSQNNISIIGDLQNQIKILTEEINNLKEKQ